MIKENLFLRYAVRTLKVVRNVVLILGIIWFAISASSIILAELW